MEETNSIKDAIKERLTSPFLGKLVITWLLWNWKIPYVTFFVDTNDLDSKNRLDYVSQYLEIDSGSDFLVIHGVPILITFFLIWAFPYLSHEAYKASESFRKRKALRKKKTNNEINNYKEKQISKLTEDIACLRKNSQEDLEKIKELSLMARYLSDEPNLITDKNCESINLKYRKKYDEEIYQPNKIDKVFSLLEGYHIKNKSSYFEDLEKKDLKFLITHDILENDNTNFHLTKYGEFISKNILYSKYKHTLPFFDDYFVLNE